MEFIEREHQDPPAPYMRAAIVRGLVVALLWVILTGGSLAYWGVGLLAIAAATVASLDLMRPGAWRWNLAGLARFLPFFAWRSLLGGIDVSRRALHPRMPIEPGFVEYTFRLPPGPWRVFLINALSLMPGTFGCWIEGDNLRIHALDATMPVVEELQTLEERVADLFGVELERHS